MYTRKTALTLWFISLFLQFSMKLMRAEASRFIYSSHWDYKPHQREKKNVDVENEIETTERKPCRTSSIKHGGPHFVLDYGTSMMISVMKYDLKITSLSNKRCILALYYTESTIQNLV